LVAESKQSVVIIFVENLYREMKSRIIPKHRLTIDKKSTKRMDSVKWIKDNDRAEDVIWQAKLCWDSLRDFRVERERCLRYTYGDQWGDMIMRDNECISEKEDIINRGDVPLTNNLIRRLVRTVVGVYREQNKIPACTAVDRDEQSLGDMMSVALQVNWKNNVKKELDARGFEEFLISGFACQKEIWGWREAKWRDAWTRQPNPNNIFFDANMTDLRGWDMSMIGELHDLSFKQVCSKFAHSPSDFKKLSAIYASQRDEEYMQLFVERGKERWSINGETNFDFFIPYDKSLCRVIEVWSKETKPRYRCHDWLTGELFKVEIADKEIYDTENASRIAEGVALGMAEDDIPLIDMEWFLDDYWYYRFMSPCGDILEEGESEFDHKSHPYSLKLYPFINGEIHSFVGDVIDQQRYVNRLISLNDKLIQSSAKGILFYPTSMIPEGKSPEDIQREWTRPDAVMFYDDMSNMASGAKPEQIANKLTRIGTEELLQLEIGLMEEITGVSGALQGKPGFSGQSAALYAQQTQNATASIMDLLESYDSFIIEGATKKVSNMQQYYDEEKTLTVVGRRNAVTYDPELVGGVMYDLNITQHADTPAVRALNNELVMQLFQMGAINVLQLLEFGNFPFSDGLMEAIKADQARVAQGQMPQGVPEDVTNQMQEYQQQIAQSGNQAAIRQAQWAIMNPERAAWQKQRAAEGLKR